MLSRIGSARGTVLSVVTLALVACGDSTSTAPEIGGEALLAKAPAPGLIVTPSTSTIHIGTSRVVTVTNANGSAINKQAVWTSSDTAVATVAATGLATAAVIARKVGTATITATVTNKTSTHTTTILPIPVHSVTLSPDSARIQVGDQLQYTAVPRDSAGNPLSGRTVSWSVTSPSVAAISSNGLATGLAVGATRVIALVEGRADTTWLTVEQTPARIDLVEMSVIFDALGESKQLVANVYDKKDNLMPNAVVTWESDSVEIATVTSTGVLTPVTTAQYAWTFVSASIGSLADSATVTVYRHPTSVVASPDTMFVNQLTPIGESAGQFTAAMFDRNGYVIEGGWLLFESLESQTASVSIDGHVVAHQNGQARIVAISFSGVHDTVLVIVNAPPPSPEPGEFLLAQGRDDVDVFARPSRFDWTPAARKAPQR
jgi:uncharacterized protein YjdB